MSDAPPPAQVSLQVFGQMRLVRDDRIHLSPVTRKTRAILGFLALSPRPVSRQRLCEMFFDLPDDPRASLRWSLTKLRPLVDAPDKARLISERDALHLSPDGLEIDACRVLELAGRNHSNWTAAECECALESMQGALLEDCELPDRPEYTAWLSAQRQDFKTIATQLAQWLANASDGAERLKHLRKLVALDPLDEVAVGALARELVSCGQREEANKVVSQAERNLSQAGLPAGPGLRMALRQSSAEPAIIPSQIAPAPRDGRLHVAIMPFVNHSRDILSDDLTDGMLEAAIHMLSKFRGLRLAAFANVLPHKLIHRKPDSVCAELGVSNLVGGALLVRNGQLRVRYRLLASDGALLTSGDFSHDETEAGALLEDVPARLVTFLAHHLGDAARKASLDLPAGERTPRDHLAVGIHLGFFAYPLDYKAALESFETGLKIDPDFPPLNAYGAWARALLGHAMAEPHRSIALAQASRAMAQSDPEGESLAMAAWSAVHIGQDFEPALRAVELATRLNPLSRVAWSASAWVRAMGGEVETPLQHWDMAEQCNPLSANIDATHCGRAICCWMAGRYDEAIHWAKRGLDWQPSHPAGHLAAVASAIAMGDKVAAAEQSMTMLRYFPTAPDIPAMSSIPIRDKEMKQRLLEAIREGVRLAAERQNSDIDGPTTVIPTLIQR